VKYALIKDNGDNVLSKSRLFSLLECSGSAYYEWVKGTPSKRELANNSLRQAIAQVYWKHAGRYGYRRIYYELVENYSYRGSRERVRKQLKKLGLRAIIKRRFKVTTDSAHSKSFAENLLQQDFATDEPNRAWVGDITYIRVGQSKWLYLAVIIDLYSRKVIGWSMSKRITARLVCNALKMALRNRSTPKGVIVHSDRGSQYCSNAYQDLLEDHALICSMSGKGNCYDNAVAESFFHTLKSEHVYRFRYDTHEQARRSIYWYIEAYYNRVRRHSSMNYQSPVDFENAA